MGTRKTQTRECQKFERNLLFRVMKSTKTSSRMQDGNWKHRWQLQFHVKERLPKPAIGKQFALKREKAEASETKTRFSYIAEAHESTRPRIEPVTKRCHEEQNCKEKTRFIITLQLSAHIYYDAPSNENSRFEGSSGKEIGKIGENFGVEPDESQK